MRGRSRRDSASVATQSASTSRVRSGEAPAGDAAALPTAAELDERLARAEPVQPPPRLMPYHGEIAELVGAGLQVKVAWERFSSAHPDARVSYTAFRRFVRRYVEERPRRAVVRLEVGPGEEAQVDFGYVGAWYPARRARRPGRHGSS